MESEAEAAPPPGIPAEGDTEEDVPSDFFDEFNKDEFLDGLSVIDSWDEPGGKRRVLRIDAEAVESVQDLRELIQDKEDVRRPGPGTLRRRSGSRSRLDDYIKPGSRRDPCKTLEAIKRDKEVKVKEYLAKHLESTDVLRPPGTELDDFFDVKPKEIELKKEEYLYDLQKSHLIEKKSKLRRSPRHSPVRTRPSPRRSPYIRKSPRHGVHDQTARGLRLNRLDRSPVKLGPPRYVSRRRSPMHSRRHSRSPQRRRSPQLRRSRTRSPQRRRSRTRSPLRRRSRTRSPHHQSRRSPFDHGSRHRSPLDQGRQRTRSRERHSSYDYSKDTMPHGFGGPFQGGPGPFGQAMDFPGPMMGSGAMPGMGPMPGPGQMPGPGILGPGPMPGYAGPPGPGQFPLGPGFPTPAYGGPGPGPYDFRDMPGILGAVPEPVPAPVMNPTPGPVPLPGAPPMVPPPQQMMEPQMSQPREPAKNFQVAEIKKPYDALAQLVAEGKLSKEDYLKLAPNKGVTAKMHGLSSTTDNLGRVNVLSRCSEAIAKLGTLRVPNKLLMNTSIPIVEPKVIAPKFCSPLKRQVPIEFTYTSASAAVTSQHNKQLLESIINTIGLKKFGRLKKKSKKNTRDAAVQTTKPYCDVCEIRDAKEFFDASTRIDPEHFTLSQHTQVLEQDLMNSRSMFNPSGSMGDGAPMSIAHMTPAQLVSQLAARAKTLKQSDQQQHPSNQYGRPNYDYDDPNYDRGQIYKNNYNNYNRY